MKHWRITCEGSGGKQHSPKLLGIIADAWNTPWPASNATQAAHHELAARVLGDRYEPEPSVEPMGGLIGFAVHEQTKRGRRIGWRTSRGVVLAGGVVTLTCPTCSAERPLREVEVHAHLATLPPGATVEARALGLLISSM